MSLSASVVGAAVVDVDEAATGKDVGRCGDIVLLTVGGFTLVRFKVSGVSLVEDDTDVVAVEDVTVVVMVVVEMFSVEDSAADRDATDDTEGAVEDEDEYPGRL